MKRVNTMANAFSHGPKNGKRIVASQKRNSNLTEHENENTILMLALIGLIFRDFANDGGCLEAIVVVTTHWVSCLDAHNFVLCTLVCELLK